MKRLKYYLSCMRQDDESYRLMYEGPMRDAFEGVWLYEPVYWSKDEDYAFRIEQSSRGESAKPSLTVLLRAERLWNGEDDTMKRLKYYLLQLQENDTTYKPIYEGKMDAQVFKPSEEPYEFGEELRDPVYWRENGVSFHITETNKLAKDCPTVTVRIPADTVMCGTDGLLPADAAFCGFSAEVSAAADFCLRAFGEQIALLNAELYNRARPDTENGAYYIAHPGGEVLPTNGAYFAMCTPKYYTNGAGTTVYIRDNDQKECKPVLCLCITMQVQLPYRKHKKAIRMLCTDLPAAVDAFIRSFDSTGCEAAVRLARRQEEIRMFLKNSGYCAFVADGSILPRDGESSRALASAVPFVSPAEDAVEVCGIRGMGVRRGVTVITGGGYSGKSTLLDAIAAGIYNHIAGDGREYCITDETAVGIAAEDGRCVKNLNISPFIKWLPRGDTADFSTGHASGSTSEAANIMEAVDAGARLLLIDEDRSATNFMIRDRLMKTLIRREPITPFTDRVRELAARGTSTILVIGGSGEYLGVADTVLCMDEYRAYDVTETAKALALEFHISPETPQDGAWEQHRALLSAGFTTYPAYHGSERLSVSETGFLLFGEEAVDLRGVAELLTDEQKTAAAFVLRTLSVSAKEETASLSERLDALYEKLEQEGIDQLYTSVFPEMGRFLTLPRKQDVLAVVNRMRSTQYRQKS